MSACTASLNVGMFDRSPAEYFSESFEGKIQKFTSKIPLYLNGKNHRWSYDNTNMTTQSFHVKFSWNQPGFLQIGALARVTCALHVAQKGISTTTGCLGTNRRCLMVLRWTLRTDLGIVGYDYHLPKYIAIVVYHLSDSEYGLSFYIIYIYIITKADIICIYIYIRSTETESRKTDNDLSCLN